VAKAHRSTASKAVEVCTEMEGIPHNVYLPSSTRLGTGSVIALRP
jgi:hypothetical protein